MHIMMYNGCYFEGGRILGWRIWKRSERPSATVQSTRRSQPQGSGGRFLLWSAPIRMADLQNSSVKLCSAPRIMHQEAASSAKKKAGSFFRLLIFILIEIMILILHRDTRLTCFIDL